MALDDFNNSDLVDGPDMRVAASYGLNPPDFAQDQQAGNSLGAVNPVGLRLAKYQRKGTIGPCRAERGPRAPVAPRT